MDERAPDVEFVPQSTLEGDWWAWSDSPVVSRLHRLGVAAAHRLPLGDRREPLLRRWRMLIHRGERVECPLCGSRFRHFAARWNTPNVVCWSCDSHERHRTLGLLLLRMRPDLLQATSSLLHFAPEPGIERILRPHVHTYVSADLDGTRADLALDITAIDLPDASQDAIICSHVLEHVREDRRAMEEMLRVLRPGGWLIVMVPVDHGLASTDEDPAVVTAEDRRRRFWQEDHVRLYALDIVDRLTEAGFEVEHRRPTEELPSSEVERFRLGLGNDVFLCRRPAEQAA